MARTFGVWAGNGCGAGRAPPVRPAHSEPIGRRRITGTWAMIRNWVQISPAIAS
ncbi:hypothetical protein MPOCJGCO_4367 [Methylobacterium trifolii]|uniref:Uncharacterized protein n=1 Tax=Methylobacterium trifolii TaxID=1003092 RepID=A0ABQ4U458_9HYPH|nr:hypothetical protein MPOCJGCO_4367 [Methylobacterium trifolii]